MRNAIVSSTERVLLQTKAQHETGFMVLHAFIAISEFLSVRSTGFLLACVLFLTGVAHGQIQPRGSINLVMGIPVSDFADHVDNLGFGIDLNGGIGLKPAPFMIGIELGYLVYGIERRSEPFSSTIPDVRVDVETTNNIALGHLFLRLQPQSGSIQPYADALFGFKYLFTQTSVRNRRSEEEIAVSTNFDDFASSYGFGGGVDIRVFERERENSRSYRIFIHGGVRYLLGSNAEYLKRGSIRRENGEVIFDVTKSRTDLVIPQLGATFSF